MCDDCGAMTATMPFRAIRAAAFAAVSVALGVGAHAVGGGSVSVVAVLMALLIAFLPAHALARRERTLAVILPALVASQAALHLLFSFVHTLEPSVAGSAMSGGHVHSGLVPGLGMLVMHGWAVALTAVWLAHGEALLWALLRPAGRPAADRVRRLPGPGVRRDRRPGDRAPGGRAVGPARPFDGSARPSWHRSHCSCLTGIWSAGSL